MSSKFSPEFPAFASFRLFPRLHENGRSCCSDILSLTKDILAGVKLGVEFMERLEKDAEVADESSPTFFNSAHANILQCFSIASCATLSGVIERRFDYLNVQFIRRER